MLRMTGHRIGQLGTFFAGTSSITPRKKSPARSAGLETPGVLQVQSRNMNQTKYRTRRFRATTRISPPLPLYAPAMLRAPRTGA
jgi:hypothetical protein